MNERIKKARKALGLTQQEFANRLGIARGNIGAYEVGKNAPSDSVISLICREFDVNEDWLRNGNGDMFVEKTRDEQIASFIGTLERNADDDFKKRFISMLSQLDEDEWEVLEQMALRLSQEQEQEEKEEKEEKEED